jgi:hypothetical protein
MPASQNKGLRVLLADRGIEHWQAKFVSPVLDANRATAWTFIGSLRVQTPKIRFCVDNKRINSFSQNLDFPARSRSPSPAAIF